MERIGRALGLTGEANEDVLLPNTNQRENDEAGVIVTNERGGDDEGWVLTGGAAPGPPQAQQMTVPFLAGANVLQGLAIAQNQGPNQQGQPAAQQQQQPTTPKTSAEFSGLGLALTRMGHTMYNPRTLEAELSLQAGAMEGNAAALARFKDFAVNYGQLRVYGAILGDQKTITMIHTLGTFYSLKRATNAYQGKVLGFIGDRRATKEPTPICLPQTKAWQWFRGLASNDRDLFESHYADPGNNGRFWSPTGEKVELKAPFLLALPNALVEVLRGQDGPVTPGDVAETIDEVMANAGEGLDEMLWETVRNWCFCASQAGTNGKSLMAIEVDSVVIDDEEFDKWVGDRLDQSLGHCHTATGNQAPPAPQAPTPITDYIQLSHLLATTVGQGMMHFTQAIAPYAQAGTGLSGTAGALKTGKGFDRDQIAKLKDACGVQQAKDIPNIWYTIQSTKGKAYDAYRDHLKKSIEMWCRKRNIERDKSIFLKQSFFDDLVKLRFNPGGPVAQYESVDKGISILVCRSLSAAEVELQRGYEEATELTKSTRRLKDLLKEKNKTTTPAQNYMELKLNIGTFCALLWALFGDQCDYYRELLKLHNILDQEECFTIRDAYTKELCARITWMIINNGRSYFGRNPVASDFGPGMNFNFSVSFLDAITNEVRHGLAVQRANFPVQ